jgi:Alginate lyase
MNRRAFLKSAAVAVTPPFFASFTKRVAYSAPSHSSTFNLVAATDRHRILAAANLYLPDPPVTITAFPAPPRSAGGLHDFYSQADYFWPDPANPSGPYINRDGQSNPDNFDDHRRVMVALSIRVPALTAAWLLAGDQRYAHRAADHLRAWFVTPATRMNPNLLYAQAVVGRSTGRNYGIIDTLHLVEVARAASFLSHPVMSSQDTAACNAWFAAYLDWLTTSDRGKEERDTLNNHAMCWALQAAEFARLTANTAVRADVYRRYREILLPNQLAPDGSFPKELARTKPYSYSIFNFDIMAALCQSLKDLTPNPNGDPLTFELPDHRGLARAAEFLYPFLKDKSTWRWARDVEHWDSLPVRSPGLLFSGVAFHQQPYIDLWKTLDPDPTDKEIIRNFPIRQPLLWV